MADEIDRANDIAQVLLTADIEKAKHKAPVLRFTGSCYNCEDAVAFPAHFCGIECRQDYEMRVKQTQPNV